MGQSGRSSSTPQYERQRESFLRSERELDEAFKKMDRIVEKAQRQLHPKSSSAGASDRRRDK